MGPKVAATVLPSALYQEACLFQSGLREIAAGQCLQGLQAARLKTGEQVMAGGVREIIENFLRPDEKPAKIH
jgi:hypothetical protein